MCQLLHISTCSWHYADEPVSFLRIAPSINKLMKTMYVFINVRVSEYLDYSCLEYQVVFFYFTMFLKGCIFMFFILAIVHVYRFELSLLIWILMVLCNSALVRTLLHWMWPSDPFHPQAWCHSWHLQCTWRRKLDFLCMILEIHRLMHLTQYRRVT